MGSTYREFVRRDRIPVAMILKSIEKATATYRFTLGKVRTPNEYGWKVAHLNAVGLGNAGQLEAIPIAILRDRFVRFLSPRNMFLVPTAYAGLAELPEMCEAIRSVRGTA